MGRSIGIGMDYSPTSKIALQWAIDNLIGEDDHLIIIHVLSPKLDTPNKLLFADTGSPLIPLEELREINVSKYYGLTPDSEVLHLLHTVSRIKGDSEVLHLLHTVSRIKGVKVSAKVFWGDPRENLCQAVEQHKLDSLVVGSRGFGVLKRVLLGSVSNYVVQNATCPVTVVKGPSTSKAY